MNSILAIMALTFKEGLRHKILTGILFCIPFIIAGSLLLSGVVMFDRIKVLLDFCLSSMNVGALLVPFFLTVIFLSKNIENRSIFTLLSRPISRKQYILGRFLGLAMLIFIIIALLTITTLIATQVAGIIFPPRYLAHFSFLPVITAAFMVFLEVLVLNSIAFLWCCITTSSFIATLLILSTYLIGQTVEDMVHFISLQIAGAEVSPLVQYTLNTVLYIFPNLAAFDMKLLAVYSQQPSLIDTALLTIYGCSYIGIMLSLTILFFNKRDLP